ncbi:MAG: RND transporter [Alteromonadaceae bacterium]|nr:MAG: RND transporter [Alteromonadaceae bacterium]
MITQYADGVMRFRWPIVVTTLLLVVLAAAGVKGLAFSDDYRVFFGEGNPQLTAFEDMQDTYDKSDNVLMLVTPKQGSVFTKETLASIEWLTEQAWQTPYSNRVDSITNYQHTTVMGDDLEVADLVVDAQNLSAESLKNIEQVALKEPVLKNRLVSLDGSVTAVNIVFQLPGRSLTETPEVAAFVRDLAAKLEQRNANLELRLTGMVMLNNAFGESSQQDMATLVPIMFLVVIVTLGLLLRSVWGILVTVVVIMMSIATAMGIFGWFGLKLTPPSASAPTIILTMVVADAVHLLVSFFAEMRNGLVKRAAMAESIRINMTPIFLTSMTTAIGFLTMNFSDVPPLRDLGNIVAVGVLATFVISVTFLPALMVILPVRTPSKADHKSMLLASLSEWVISKRKPLLWGSLAVSFIFISQLPKNEINDEFVKYFSTSVDFRNDSDYASENLIGPYSLEFSFQSGAPGGVSEPKFLANLEAFVEHLSSYDSVTHIYSIIDTMKRLNKNMHGDDSSMYRLPESRELAAQYLLLYEMSLPYGLDLNNQIDIDKSSTRIVISIKNMSSNQVLALEDSVNQWLVKNIVDYQVTTASTILMFSHIGYRNVRSLIGGAAIALVMISVILIIALRSFRMGLISLIPNLLPAGVAFGLWGLIGGQVGMSVSIVAGMTLGIIVDDTVHFLSKYMRARREKNFNSADATRYAFTHVGVALVVTTIVLVLGFMVLTLSTFRMNADMGIVTAITIAAALVIDFLLLPPLLMALDTNKEAAKVTSNTEDATAEVYLTSSGESSEVS